MKLEKKEQEMSSKFKTADSKQRERATSDRTARGLSYLNSEFGFVTFQPQDGDNSIRIVPPLGDDPNASLWGLDVWVYYLNGRTYLSPKTFQQDAEDPIFDMFSKVRQEDAEAAKTYKGTKRSLTFIQDMMDDGKLKVWAAPTTVIDEILKVSKNRRTGELIPVEDPKDGRIVFFSKTGQGIQTRYGAFALDSEPCPLSETIADELAHFKDFLIVSSADELREVLANLDKEDSGDGAQPVARTRRDAEPEASQEPAKVEEPKAVAPSQKAPTQQTQAPAPEASSGNDTLKARVAARIAARQKNSG